MNVVLPAEFSDLQLFAEKWALPNEDLRRRARRASTPDDLRVFYDAMAVRIRDVLAALDQFPVGKIPASHQPLMDLAKAVIEIAPNVELYRANPLVPHAFDEDRFFGTEGRI